MRAAVIACLLLLARPALADDAAKRLAAIKAMFDVQTKSFISGDDTPDPHDKILYKPVELAVGDAAIAWAKLRMKLPGKPKWYPLDGFAILRKVGDRSEIVALVYGS